MTSATIDHGATTSQSDTTNSWLGVVLIVGIALVLAAIFAINDYASGTGAIVRNAEANAIRFETVFRDLMQARFRAMNLASEVMLQSRVTLRHSQKTIAPA